MGEAGEEGLRTAGTWRSRLGRWLPGLADQLLKVEPLWVTPALAFTCTSLLWGLSHSWIGLVISSIPLVLRRWRRGCFSRRTPFDAAAALFLLASLVGLLFSPDRGLSLRVFQSCLTCILLYYSLINITRPAYIKWGLAFAAVCVFVAGLLAFRDGFTPPSVVGGFGVWFQEQLRHLPQLPHLSQMASPTLSAAHGLAIAVEMVLLPLAGLVLFSRKASSRIVAAFLLMPLLLLLLLFGSQAAWLAVIVGLSLLLAWRTRWSALPLAVVAGLGYLGYRQGWLDPHPFFSGFDPGESLRARVELWKAAVDVIRHHPITGCGLGCLGNYSTTTFLSPHNAYLQFYADVGLVGALALLAALIAGGTMAADLVKVPRDRSWYGLAVGILAAAVAVAVHGLFEGSPAGIIAETTDGYYYVVSPAFAILAGLFVTTRHLMEESTPGTQSSVPQHPLN